MQPKEKETRDLWQNGSSKEFGRLADGFPGKVTNEQTLFVLSHKTI